MHLLEFLIRGIGGLTVLSQFIRHLPGEKYIYFGDTARVPYGCKSRETVIRFSREASGFLMRHGIKLLVVACNSASALAVEVLRKELPIPVMGVIEPGAVRAVEVTSSGRIGIIGTTATISSEAYPRALEKQNSKILTFSQACPLFVSLAEENWIRHPACRLIAEEYLAPMKKKDIDVLILGCTHYPILKPVIAEIMGPKVKLVDSAESTALEVVRFFRNSGISPHDAGTVPDVRYFVSDLSDNFKAAGEPFLGRTMDSVTRVQVEELEKACKGS